MVGRPVPAAWASTPDLHLLSGGYALDALDDVERAGYERHLRSCGSCAAEVIEFQEAGALLAGRFVVNSPDRLRTRLLSDVMRTRQLPPAGPVRVPRPSLRRVVSMVAAAVLIAVSAGLGGAAWRGERAAERTNEVTRVLTAPDRSEVTRPVAGGGSVTMVAAAGSAVLVTRGLPAPVSGRTYQIWLFDEEGVRPMDLLKVRNGFGQALVRGVDAGSSVAVSVEPAGGSLRPTTAPFLKLRVR